MTTPWQERHRGPYGFMLIRPAKKPGFMTTEWLRGEIDSDSVEDEAKALLADPRDTIHKVLVWSHRENQFVMTYNKESA